MKGYAASLSSLAVFATACAGPAVLRPEAKSITVVHETDKPLHCKVVGDIMGRGKGKNEAAAREAAMIEFRNAAADDKATHALVDSETSGPVGTTDDMQAFVGGKALQCTNEPPDEDSPPDAGINEAPEAPPGL